MSILPSYFRHERWRRERAHGTETLVAASHDATGEQLRACLEASGYLCRRVAHYAEALALLAAKRDIGVVFCAVRLKDGDGFALAQDVARLKNRARPSFIFFSRHAGRDCLRRALEVRAVRVLEEPLKHADIIESVRRALGEGAQGRAEHELRGRARLPPPGGEEGDLGAIRRLSAELLQHLQYLHDKQPLPANDGVLRPPLLDRESHLLVVARRFNQAKAAFAASHILSDVSLAMLLELYDICLRGETAPVTALCHASGGPQSTALRHLKALERAGLVQRRPDAGDQRRIMVTLTTRGARETRRYLDALDGCADR